MSTPSNDIIIIFIIIILYYYANNIQQHYFFEYYYASTIQRHYLLSPDILNCIFFLPAPGLWWSPPPLFLLDRVKFEKLRFQRILFFWTAPGNRVPLPRFFLLYFFRDFFFACKLATEFWVRRLRMRSCRVTKLCPHRGMRLISRSWNLALFSGSCACIEAQEENILRSQCPRIFSMP